MSNTEIHPTHTHRDYPDSPSITISIYHSDPPPSTSTLKDDPEKTPTSSVPLLSPGPASCQAATSSDRGPLSPVTSIWQWALVLFVTILSIAYLTFCYVVRCRTVLANLVPYFDADSTAQVPTIFGAGLTSVNIIIISLSLFPLKGLICELQSEEFFRLLLARRNSHGVKLTAVNGISNSSYGLIESITAVIHRHCSVYYVMALVATAFVLAVSSLAPAALSIQPILVDGPIMAFSVGAIPPLSLYQPVAAGQVLTPSSFSPAPGYSAAIVWAEREIGLSYSFSVSNDTQGIYSGFVVPTPQNLNSTVNVRWLTDVIGLNSYCTWANPVNLTATSINSTMNSTQVPTNAVSVYLEDLDLEVSVPSSYFPVYDSFFVTSINVHDPTVTVLNYTTGSLPTDGATVISVIQCTSSKCTKEAIDIISLFVDFTNVPSMRFSSAGADYEIGFLVCKPNITIETREVRTQGSMTLEVQPLANVAEPYPRQNNLDWTQTSLITAYSLSGLTTDSGPASSAWFGLGSGTQADFIFGSSQMNAIPSGMVYENTTRTLSPLPLEQLTQGYTRMVMASMKPYVSGSLGTSYVPGRVASVQQIFVSSLPHTITSTVLLLLLFVMAVAAYFRRGKGDQFNLTNVAAALADSELPQTVKKVKVDVKRRLEERQVCGGRWWLGSNVGQEVVDKLGDWYVSLERSTEVDALEVLQISRG